MICKFVTNYFIYILANGFYLSNTGDISVHVYCLSPPCWNIGEYIAISVGNESSYGINVLESI